jgi:hypothetical protein
VPVDFYSDINASFVLLATHAIALVVGLVVGWAARAATATRD